jgi:hypothetical protein
MVKLSAGIVNRDKWRGTRDERKKGQKAAGTSLIGSDLKVMLKKN